MPTQATYWSQHPVIIAIPMNAVIASEKIRVVVLWPFLVLSVSAFRIFHRLFALLDARVDIQSAEVFFATMFSLSVYVVDSCDINSTDAVRFPGWFRIPFGKYIGVRDENCER